MISIRHSAAETGNRELRQVRAKPGETNSEWLARVGATDGVLLIGGNALAHFRVRVAQSHLRSDMLPSFWSLAGILYRRRSLFSVPLDGIGDASDVPLRNGVE